MHRFAPLGNFGNSDNQASIVDHISSACGWSDSSTWAGRCTLRRWPEPTGACSKTARPRGTA
eukprot:5078919-Amphidinium_carterae.1